MRGWTLGVLMLCLAVDGRAGADDVEPIAPGTAAPTWKGLTGVDGKRVGLDDFKKAKLIVLVFTSNECPYAQAYEDRMNAFAKAYAAKGVALLAINVEDSLDAMKARADEKGFVFPYLSDSRQEVSRAYGATVTPHFFVLDADRTIAYVGAFDDAYREDKVKRKHLSDAVDALLEGSKPKSAKTSAIGCSIVYRTSASKP